MNNRTNIGPMTITSPAPKRAAPTPNVPARDTAGQVPERQHLIDAALADARSRRAAAREYALMAVLAMANGESDAEEMAQAAYRSLRKSSLLTAACGGGGYTDDLRQRIDWARNGVGHDVEGAQGTANIRKVLTRHLFAESPAPSPGTWGGVPMPGRASVEPAAPIAWTSNPVHGSFGLLHQQDPRRAINIRAIRALADLLDARDRDHADTRVVVVVAPDMALRAQEELANAFGHRGRFYGGRQRMQLDGNVTIDVCDGSERSLRGQRADILVVADDGFDVGAIAGPLLSDLARMNKIVLPDGSVEVWSPAHGARATDDGRVTIGGDFAFEPMKEHVALFIEQNGAAQPLPENGSDERTSHPRLGIGIRIAPGDLAGPLGKAYTEAVRSAIDRANTDLEKKITALAYGAE